MIENINQRWYDSDPTVSLAISFIRNLSTEQQSVIARQIIEKSKQFGITINEVRIVLNRRWYDENPELSDAMEFIKQASPEDKKAIALDIIDFLTQMK